MTPGIRLAVLLNGTDTPPRNHLAVVPRGSVDRGFSPFIIKEMDGRTGADGCVQTAIQGTPDQPTNTPSHAPLRIDPGTGERPATQNKGEEPRNSARPPSRAFRTDLRG